MPSDPLAPLSDLPGVADGVARARSAVDALLNQARATPDQAKRRDVYGQIITRLHQDVPLPKDDVGHDACPKCHCSLIDVEQRLRFMRCGSRGQARVLVTVSEEDWASHRTRFLAVSTFERLPPRRGIAPGYPQAGAVSGR